MTMMILMIYDGSNDDFEDDDCDGFDDDRVGDDDYVGFDDDND